VQSEQHSVAFNLRGDSGEIGVEEIQLFLAKLHGILLDRTSQEQLVCREHRSGQRDRARSKRGDHVTPPKAALSLAQRVARGKCRLSRQAAAQGAA